MPPQPTQRMVQYSELARPRMIRSTVKRPLQSGQLERTGARAWRIWLRSMIVTLSLPPRSGGPFVLETVDVLPGVLDHRLRRVPGKADLQRRERMAVDQHGPRIRPADPRMPLSSAHLEGFDVVLVVALCHLRRPSPLRAEGSTGRPGSV